MCVLKFNSGRLSRCDKVLLEMQQQLKKWRTNSWSFISLSICERSEIPCLIICKDNLHEHFDKLFLRRTVLTKAKTRNHLHEVITTITLKFFHFIFINQPGGKNNKEKVLTIIVMIKKKKEKKGNTIVMMTNVTTKHFNLL